MDPSPISHQAEAPGLNGYDYRCRCPFTPFTLIETWGEHGKCHLAPKLYLEVSVSSRLGQEQQRRMGEGSHKQTPYNQRESERESQAYQQPTDKCNNFVTLLISALWPQTAAKLCAQRATAPHADKKGGKKQIGNPTVMLQAAKRWVYFHLLAQYLIPDRSTERKVTDTSPLQILRPLVCASGSWSDTSGCGQRHGWDAQDFTNNKEDSPLSSPWLSECLCGAEAEQQRMHSAAPVRCTNCLSLSSPLSLCPFPLFFKWTCLTLSEWINWRWHG